MGSKHLPYAKYTSIMRKLDNKLKKDFLDKKSKKVSKKHELVETTIEFSCTKYESTQINKVAAALINRYRILTNSLNFNSGITTKTLNGGNGKENDPIDLKYTRYYDHKSNKMVNGSKSGSAKTSVNSFNLSYINIGLISSLLVLI